MDDITFIITWLGFGREEIGTTEITCHDLTDAVNLAGRLIVSPGSNKAARDAHGFFAQSARLR
jgi:hypothetical protein